MTKTNVKKDVAMVPFTVEMPKQRIADVLTSGMEGGIGYWATITGFTKPTEMTFRLDPKHLYRHIDYAMNPGGAVILKDTEGNKTYRLTYKKLIDGLKIMAQKHPRHFSNIMEENDDAETGDVLIQLALLGDIVYG